NWWVRAVDKVNSPGSWSAAGVFTVKSLAVPQLNGPSGAITSTLPTFRWNSITGASHYDIWVQDMKTNQILRNQDVTAPSWKPASPLNLQDTYTWWVRAVDGVNSPGQWSSGQTFTIFALPAPSLLGPSGSAAASPTFRWNAVTGASRYDIWVQDVRTGAVLRDTNVTAT